MNTTQETTIGLQAQRDPAQIEQEIGQQRQHIEEIVQALGSKLSPGEMLDQVLTFGKGGGKEFTGNLAQAIKDNPLPALVAAAGLAWLYSANRSAGTTTVTISETTTTEVPATSGIGLSDRLHSAKSAIGEKASGAAGSIKSGASSAKQSVASGFGRAAEGYGGMLQENPLAAGAIAVAVGALLGALIPPTRKEDEMMGEASDRMIDKVKGTAREHGSQLAHHAREMTSPSSSSSSTQSTAGTDVTGQGVGSGQDVTAAAYGSQRAH